MCLFCSKMSCEVLIMNSFGKLLNLILCLFIQTIKIYSLKDNDGDKNKVNDIKLFQQCERKTQKSNEKQQYSPHDDPVGFFRFHTYPASCIMQSWLNPTLWQPL